MPLQLGARFLLVSVLAAPGPSVGGEAPQVDLAATEQGLRIRLGAAFDGWSVTVHDTGIVSQVEVELTAPDGRSERRQVVLGGVTAEERSRELAAALALIIEQSAAPEPEPRPPEPVRGPEPKQPVPAVSGWVGVGPRVALGEPAAIDADYGASVHGGLWLLRDHLQPILQATWSRTPADPITLDGLRAGAGLAAGASVLDRRVWLGGGFVAHALWAKAVGERTATRWTSSTELFVLLQYRGPRGLLLGLRTGVDLGLPPVRVEGQTAEIRWGALRYVVGLTIGGHF